ncbi:unnamed protein product [Trifolium pratense]|uniref:Uncharacterized protein n=1 Tax=Trifolium pratense TaxID=57577 RepID=A0ACB0M1L1_TRIPR|nr:unnamed protein product [Trifolium pratense]
MSSSNESSFIHIEESQHTISQSSCLHESFYVKIHHFHSNSSKHYFCFIPRNILCDYHDFESMDPDSFTSTFLRDIFSCVRISSEVLEQTLRLMSDYARYMNTVNTEGNRILEMDVFVSTTSNDGGHGIDDQNASITTLLSSLEKVKLDDITCSTVQCAICLEEFCNESKPKIVRTKCMHVFHEHCIVRWLKQCGITSRLYLCPLCRFEFQ